MDKFDQVVFNYPVVIRKIGLKFFLSVPDLGFWQEVKLAEKNDDKISAKTSKLQTSEKFEITPDFKVLIMNALIDIWKEIDGHLNTKKWIPEPSHIKQTLQHAESDFTLPAFTKKLNQYMTISENTVRREIERGSIQCYQTVGGHRRIPYSELQIYLVKQKKSSNLESIF